MSAANALSSDLTSQAAPEARPVEPSMEDILASIRRIIADDQSRSLTSTPSAQRRAPMNVTPPTVRIERPAGALPSQPPVRPPNATERRWDAAAAPAVPPPETVSAPALAAKSFEMPTPHLNPPPFASGAAAPVENEEHLAVLSEIAKVGVASILSPRAEALVPSHEPVTLAAALASRQAEPILVPEPAVLEEPTVDREAERLPEPAEILQAPAAGDVLALNGYEAAPADDIEEAHVPVSADPLLSDDVGASVESSFQTLATSVFMKQSGAVDSMIRDMLRPLLKTWLDDNLPTIVERLVRAEIERVARGGRH